MLPTGEERRVALTKRQAKFRNLPAAADLSNGNFRTYIADETSPAAINNPANSVYLERILDKVLRAKGFADLVAVLPRDGGQNNLGSATYAKYIAEGIRKARADVIVAGHSHTQQRMRVNDGCVICYSLGTCVLRLELVSHAKRTC